MSKFYFSREVIIYLKYISIFAFQIFKAQNREYLIDERKRKDIYINSI